MKLVLDKHDWSLAYAIESHFRYIISEQESYGWKIDINLMESLLRELGEKREYLRANICHLLGPRLIQLGEFKRVFKKDGTLMSVVEKWYNNLDKRMFKLSDVTGSFSRVSFEEVNLESPIQRIEALQKLGWKPTEYNYKTDRHNKIIYNELGEKIKLSPKLTKDSVEGLGIGEDIIEYLTLSHRYKLVKGLQERIRPDGRIGSGGITVGCNTGRMMHRNIVNIPSVDELYGGKIRSLFSCSKEHVLVGADLCSLENRLMGHYTYPFDDGDYARRLEGEDSHETTALLIAKAFGRGKSRNSICPACNVKDKEEGKEVCSSCRGTAKTLNYALGFGCGFMKVAEILGCQPRFAKKVQKLWWSDKESMVRLKEAIENSLRGRGQLVDKKLKPDSWIRGLDGRKIFVRSPHSLINALVQNAGSVVNKFITCSVYKQLKQNDVNGMFVCNYHDEINLEVKDDGYSPEAVCEIIKKSVDKCNSYFKMRVPMEMDIKIGNNWKEIH